MPDADAERKAKAARAKKLLAQRQKTRATANPPASAAPSSPASAGSPTVRSARTSLSLDDGARADVVEDLGGRAVVLSATEGEKGLGGGSVGGGTRPKEKGEGGGSLVGGTGFEEKGEAGGSVGGGTRPKEKGEGDGSVGEGTRPKEKGKGGGSAVKGTISNATAPPATVQKDNIATPPRLDTTAGSPPTDSLGNLQQTVSLLLAERTDLQAQVLELTKALDGARRDSQLLVEGRSLISRLEGEKRALEDQLGDAEADVSSNRGLRADLEKSRGEVDDLGGERDALVRARDEAEEKREREQDELGDKVAELERGLDRAREREGGLEAEIGRLRQTNTEIGDAGKQHRQELEALRSASTSTENSLSEIRASRDELQTTHRQLRADHDTLQADHAALQVNLSTLSDEHAALKSSHAESSSSQHTLDASLSSTRSELEKVKTSLGTASKRAETAEKKRAALQAENDELVEQLGEVRGRVVQVMEEKAGLAVDVEAFERRSSAWEKEKRALEARAGAMESGNSPADIATAHERLQTARDGLQKQLDESRTTISQHESTISQLRTELGSVRASHPSPNGDTPSSPPSPFSGPPSSSTDRPEHNPTSQAEKVRSLETALQASTSRIHSLSRQLTDMHAAYAYSQKERDDLLSQQAFTPGLFTNAGPSRSPKGILLSPVDETPPGMTGYGGQRLLPGNRSVDATLPLSVRNKRQVSLTALKARMEPRSVSRTGGGGRGGGSIASVMEESEEIGLGRENGSSVAGPPLWPAGGKGAGLKQFGDEIVFCCPACEGDLITL